MVCAIASDNAIKISNPTESFKIQTKAVVWPAKIKVIQDYNIRLNEKKYIKWEVLEYSDTELELTPTGFQNSKRLKILSI